MKVEIVKCSNSMYWYSKYIGQVFPVSRVTPTLYWTREPNMYQALNFIIKDDCKVIIEETRNVLGTHYG